MSELQARLAETQRAGATSAGAGDALRRALTHMQAARAWKLATAYWRLARRGR